jgi:His-Xaa-Ser system protein HxsD
MSAVDQTLPVMGGESAEYSITVRVDGNAYSKAAVFSAANRQTEHFYVSVQFENNSWLVRFRPRSQNDASLEDPTHVFLSDLVDHQLRHEMDESLRPLRELIAARAFSGFK